MCRLLTDTGSGSGAPPVKKTKVGIIMANNNKMNESFAIMLNYDFLNMMP